jgi:hypothetical protein
VDGREGRAQSSGRHVQPSIDEYLDLFRALVEQRVDFVVLGGSRWVPRPGFPANQCSPTTSISWSVASKPDGLGPAGFVVGGLEPSQGSRSVTRAGLDAVVLDGGLLSITVPGQQ